jgi:ATP-dependent Clp protease ATP-binding subunit ClpA
MAKQKSEPLRESPGISVDFAGLPPSSRAALGHAQALADEVGRDAVGVEHLLLSLFDAKSEGPTRRAMQDAGLSRQDLVETLLGIGKPVPREAAPEAKPAGSLPRLTLHAGEVLEGAF